MNGVPPRFLIGAHEVAKHTDPSQPASVLTEQKGYSNLRLSVATLTTASIWNLREIMCSGKSTARGHQ